MREKEVVGYLLILMLIIYLIFSFLKNENSSFQMNVNNNNLEILFPNAIWVQSYEIRDYEKRENGLAYKTVLSSVLLKKTNKVQINDIKRYGIKPNNAYFYSMFQEDEKNPTRRLKSLGFCIKAQIVIIQGSRERDSDFINNCKK